MKFFTNGKTVNENENRDIIKKEDRDTSLVVYSNYKIKSPDSGSKFLKKIGNSISKQMDFYNAQLQACLYESLSRLTEAINGVNNESEKKAIGHSSALSTKRFVHKIFFQVVYNMYDLKSSIMSVVPEDIYSKKYTDKYIKNVITPALIDLCRFYGYHAKSIKDITNVPHTTIIVTFRSNRLKYIVHSLIMFNRLWKTYNENKYGVDSKMYQEAKTSFEKNASTMLTI
jgi:hypothetical protein